MTFNVYGQPRGKGRPRFTRDGHAYTPKETREYERIIANSYPTTKKLGGNISLIIKAYYSIPKSTSKAKRGEFLSHRVRPTKKPDADNIIKVVADALNGVAYDDDKQIVYVSCEKFYSEEPRLEIILKGDI